MVRTVNEFRIKYNNFTKKRAISLKRPFLLFQYNKTCQSLFRKKITFSKKETAVCTEAASFI